jgi:hypothetical protein
MEGAAQRALERVERDAGRENDQQNPFHPPIVNARFLKIVSNPSIGLSLAPCGRHLRTNLDDPLAPVIDAE